MTRSNRQAGSQASAPPGVAVSRGHVMAPQPAPGLQEAVARALAPAVGSAFGFELQEAVRSGRVRVLAVHTRDGQPLPSDWAIPIRSDEVVVATAPLEAPFVGVAALIVDASLLPMLLADSQQLERIAGALVDALWCEFESEIGRP